MKRLSAHILAAVLITFAMAVPCTAGTVITGELVVTNGSSRQFRIVDHGGYFVAPSGMMIEALDGKPVVVELSDSRQVLSITEKPIHIDRVESHYETINGEFVLVDAARGTFAIAGAPQTYAAPRNIDVQRYAGRNVELFLDGQGRVLQIEFAGSASCEVGGATLANGSSICRAGVTFRCSDGSWVNVGTACR